MEYAAGQSLTKYVTDAFPKSGSGLFLKETEARYFFKVGSAMPFSLPTRCLLVLAPQHRALWLIHTLCLRSKLSPPWSTATTTMWPTGDPRLHPCHTAACSSMAPSSLSACASYGLHAWCRDLKLDNTLLDGSNPPYIKICDFGFAKSWGNDEEGNLFTQIGCAHCRRMSLGRGERRAGGGGFSRCQLTPAPRPPLCSGERIGRQCTCLQR